MPVPIGSSAPCDGSSKEMEREVSRLRQEVESLRKRKPDGDASTGVGGRLPLYLAGLSLLVSIIALFRH